MADGVDGQQYINLNMIQGSDASEQSDVEGRMLASKWTPFGISIHKLLSTTAGAKRDCPAWVDEACTFLARAGLQTKDLWTANPNKDELKKLTDEILLRGAHNQTINYGGYSVPSVATILKVYFQKLPTPVLSVELHDIWIGAATTEIFSSAAEQVEFIRAVIEVLPNANRETLRVLLRLCSAIYKSGSVENQRFIAPVWGPTILLRKAIHEFKTDVSDAARLMHLLVKNYDLLFPEGAKRPKAPATVHPWLRKINRDRLEKLTSYINKTQLVLEEMVKFGQENQMDCYEFQLNLGLAHQKLLAIQELVNDDRVPLYQIVETHHLDKYYNYISDFHDAMIQGRATNSLVRSFKSTRLRASFERLALSAHFELVLFLNLVDSIFGGALRKRNSYVDSMQKFFSGLLPADEASKDLWNRRAGTDNFIAAWPGFIAGYKEATGVSDPNLDGPMKRVLDPSDTGFVSLFRFAEFCKGFGPLRDSLKKIVDVVDQPWFHGYMTSPEADKLLEACEPGTFLVRFSASDPGSAAINFKDPTGMVQRIKIEPTPAGFGVREGTGYRTFASIKELVGYYSSYLQYPFTDRLMDHAWFYGDLSAQETQVFLDYEPIGTYLIRFSQQFGYFTCSYRREDLIAHCRLQRMPDGQIEVDGHMYASIANFIEQNGRWLLYPYNNDNTVSSSQEEDEARRVNALPFQTDEEDEKIEYKEFFIGVPTPEQLAEEEKLKDLANTATTERLKPDQKRALLDGLLASLQLGPAAIDKNALSKVETILKKSHKLTMEKLAAKRKVSSKKSLFSSKKNNLAFSHSVLVEREANLCKPHTFQLTVTNNYHKAVKFDIDQPLEMVGRHFMSCEPSSGQIDTGKKGFVNVKVTCVLYKPVSIKRFLTITVFLDEGEEYYHVPLLFCCGRAALKHEVPQDPYWTIQTSDLDMQSKIGGGASAAVFKASLFGAIVAVKKWDIGKKDEPPRDFEAELGVFKQLRHENLVLFIGAKAEIGSAYLVTEFLSHGSLDGWLQKTKEKKPWKAKLNMAIEAAKGMRYVHSHNKIHRDMKSLNLLVGQNFATKVADFGESREKDANMTQATGTYNWMAPEVLMSQNYTMKADVFSFGIILWELIEEQYPNRNMMDVQQGKVPDIPEKSWGDYFDYIQILLSCCRLNPAKRPTFSTIVRLLKSYRDSLDQPKTG